MAQIHSDRRAFSILHLRHAGALPLFGGFAVFVPPLVFVDNMGGLTEHHQLREQVLLGKSPGEADVDAADRFVNLRSHLEQIQPNGL